MKIEKISENQIRCTLTREDLEERHIKLSELAYGTDKAKDLFREMMGFASAKYGFDTDDIPLMIEAVPISSEMIILIITKVDSPEELDTRYANFSDEDDDDDESDYDDYSDIEYGGPQENTVPTPPTISGDTVVFRFDNMDPLFEVAKLTDLLYNANNSLYKRDGAYYLVIHKGPTSSENFHHVIGILSEYGSQEFVPFSVDSYFVEHSKTLISEHALQNLAVI